jgi:hypothetical protein
MISAFGVDHGVVSKVDRRAKDRAEHYGRMSGAMGALGAGAGAVGAGAGIVGAAERKGHDPMGFTFREGGSATKPLSAAAKARVLKPIAASHGWQAKTMGGLGAGALALSAGYKAKQKHEQKMMRKPLSKAETPGQKRARVATDIGMGTASAGIAGGALKYGPKNAHFLSQQGKEAGEWARGQHHMIAAHKLDMTHLEPSELKHAKASRKVNARVFAVKKPAAALAIGSAAAGGAGLYELGRHAVRRRKT